MSEGGSAADVREMPTRRRLLRGGYWRIWHDMRIRFGVGVLVVAGALFGTQMAYSPAMARPTPCVTDPGLAASGFAEPVVVLQAVPQSPELRARVVASSSAARMRHFALMSLCNAGEFPRANYKHAVMSWSDRYVFNTWVSTLPFVLLFVGIMLAVGAPFGGEGTEAAALTFSLPWSREKWLLTKAAATYLLIAALTFFAWIVSYWATSFPELMSNPELFRHNRETIFFRPTSYFVMPAFLTGIVGVSLGLAASLLVRNALLATVVAAAAGYGLMVADFKLRLEGSYFQSYEYVDLVSQGSYGWLFPIAIALLCVMIAHSKLHRTSY